MVLLATFTLPVFLFLCHDVPLFLHHDLHIVFLLDDSSKEPGAPTSTSFALLFI